SLQVLPAADDPGVARAAAGALRSLVLDGRFRELVIRKVDGDDVAVSPFRPTLLEAGFAAGYRGLLLRADRPGSPGATGSLSMSSRRPERGVPEGDTLFRTAAGLRPYLVGRTVTAARAGGPGPVPQLGRIVGREIRAVDSLGKNLLIRFDNGLEIRTHLRMNGTWHRYRPGERWRRPPARARLVIEVPGVVAVCFDAPVVELLEQRAEAVHPALGGLGPDLLAPAFDRDDAVRRLREPARASANVAEALLDQRALAGIGNVYKSETLWLERVSPFARVDELDDPTLARLVDTARRLLLANASAARGPERITTTGDRGAPGPLYVYRRTGRPCRRCGTPIVSARQGGDLPRTTYWCPSCQGLAR
ncbi:MAG TPA: DNA-formamidopyrimidine glycosylase family protein, partial [Candidatus Limnocylindrales bacterium]|nr:DNA-formamidopyrimidine glycosylase family protein [Candidatus Limnocylindrales bacterium]